MGRHSTRGPELPAAADRLALRRDFRVVLRPGLYFDSRTRGLAILALHIYPTRRRADLGPAGLGVQHPREETTRALRRHGSRARGELGSRAALSPALRSHPRRRPRELEPREEEGDLRARRRGGVRPA